MNHIDIDIKEAEADKKIVLNWESGTVYFTHVGSRSPRTDLYEIWQFFSSDQPLVLIGTVVLALEISKLYVLNDCFELDINAVELFCFCTIVPVCKIRSTQF